MENEKVMSKYSNGASYELKGERNRGGRLNPETGKKLCGRCKEEKNREFFSGRRASADGLQSYCKECNKSANRGEQPPDREKEKIGWGNWTKGNRSTNSHIPPIETECEICGYEGNRLARDHNPWTGNNRGTLCSVCNRFVGDYEWNRSNQSTEVVLCYLNKYGDLKSDYHLKSELS